MAKKTAVKKAARKTAKKAAKKSVATTVAKKVATKVKKVAVVVKAAVKKPAAKKQPIEPLSKAELISLAAYSGAPLGAHVSTAGGSATAPARATDIGATAMQLFTKVPNQWKEREFTDVEAAAFKTELAKTNVRFTNAHDSYLINLASPDATLRTRSIESFKAELRRCHALGLDALVSHPGNYIDDRESGIARNADAIVESLEATPGATRLLMELTAGQGTVIGATFEEMAALIARIPAALRTRIGVCLDTAHVFAAGYDLVNGYDGVWMAFGDIIGFDRLGLLHLNDSAVPLGARRDRHALIGEGAIGDGPFARIMTDTRLAALPKVLETPKGVDMVTNDRRMLAKLRGFAGN